MSGVVGMVVVFIGLQQVIKNTNRKLTAEDRKTKKDPVTQATQEVSQADAVPVERKSQFLGNWKIGLPISIALGIGLGVATKNLVTGLIFGLACGALSGFVVAFLKWTVRVEE